MVLIGLVLASAVIGLFYLAAGLLFRYVYKQLPRMYILVFPALWVLIDYSRSLGDISFPWAFLGYSLMPIIPLAQVASFLRCMGSDFLIVLGNMLVWELAGKLQNKPEPVSEMAPPLHFCSFSCYSRFCRLDENQKKITGESFNVSLLQTNIDQFNWKQISGHCIYHHRIDGLSCFRNETGSDYRS